MAENGTTKQPAARNAPAKTDETRKNLQIEIGNRLKDIRVENKWNQDEMADFLGIGKPFYGKIERGESGIALEKLVLLRKALNIDLNYLLTGEVSFELPFDFQKIPDTKQYAMNQLIKYAISLLAIEEK